MFILKWKCEMNFLADLLIETSDVYISTVEKMAQPVSYYDFTFHYDLKIRFYYKMTDCYLNQPRAIVFMNMATIFDSFTH